MTTRADPPATVPTRALDPALWDRVASAFEAAAEMPPDERAAYLDRAVAGDAAARAEIDAMLAIHDRDAPLRIERRLQRFARTSGEVRAGSLAVGARLGPYEVVAPVREGGMGEVYRAERVDGGYRQTVAIKVLRASVRSAELVRRFQAERQILARLVHPDVAPILDGGATPDGRPYLVMPFVDGLPITEFCEQRSLGLEARLRLFRRVAEAVQFAHGRLVVHRDLKPSNILVTAAGEPRLLDFGIAKVLGDAESGEPDTSEPTGSLLRLLTPEHAAPEQLRGEPVTTAADVYALGVLLYQMLTGRRPHAADGRHLPSLVRAVLDEPVAPPSAVAGAPLARRLRGDLDRIVLMALRKEPERRYASAGQLAEDVERFLDGRPVRAQRDTLGYRTRKFVARNRLGVAAGLALAAVLVASTVAATVQSRRVERERDRAERARESAEAVVGVLTDLFERSNPVLVPGGDTVRVAALLETGERKVDALAGEPALQARMWRVLGNLHAARGRYARAKELLERSHARQRALAGDSSGGPAVPADDAEAARTWIELARVVNRHEGPAAARPMFERGIARLRAALGEDAPDVTAAMLEYAAAVENLDARRALLDRVVERRRREGGLDSMQVARSLNQQGGERFARGAFGEARSLFDGALRIVERRLPPEHPDRLSVQHNLASSLANIGEWAEAERLSRAVLDARRRASAPDSATLAGSVEAWGVLQAYLGRHAEAEEALREALAIFRATLAPRHPRIESALRNVGLAVAARGRVAEGLALLDSAIASTRARNAPPEARAPYLGHRSLLLLRLGRRAEAAQAAREAGRIIRSTAPAGHSAHADAGFWTGVVALDAGDAPAALAAFDSARAVLLAQHPPGHPRLASADCGRAVALVRLGRPDEARPLLAQGCVTYERWGLAEPMLVAWARAARR